MHLTEEYISSNAVAKNFTEYTWKNQQKNVLVSCGKTYLELISLTSCRKLAPETGEKLKKEWCPMWLQESHTFLLC